MIGYPTDMAMIVQCIGCQFGDHEQHRRTVQAVPEGVIGGTVCLCEGECQGKPAPAIQRQIDLIRSSLSRVRQAT